jgi:uncharacterized membrane protein YbaN (DUF454 family)
MRGLWGVAGAVALLIGLTALVVPLLPTSPFLILAAACWVRASPRWEAWLVNHRWLGPPIRDWRAGRGIRMSVKLTVVAMASLGMGLALWRLPSDAHVMRVTVVACGCVTAWIVLSLPSRVD